MKTGYLGWGLIVLALSIVSGSFGAEDLGFPKSCVELQKVPSEAVSYDTYSIRDSVLFRLQVPSRTSSNDILSFVAWDTESGKWLARRPAPVPLPMNWQLSPDGKLLAVPIYGHAKVIQLWEVGSKDLQGVPQLRLMTELRRQKVDPKEPPDTFSPQYASRLAWTPDSKTLIAGYGKLGHTYL